MKKALFSIGIVSLLFPLLALASLINNGDGTLSDTTTGLMWTKTSNADHHASFSQAQNYVDALSTGGHSDWRLPTLSELESIYDEGFSWNPPSCPGCTNHMSDLFDVQCCYFWGDSASWYFYFGDGQSYNDTEGLEDGNEVLAVRYDTTDDDTTDDDSADDDASDDDSGGDDDDSGGSNGCGCSMM